LRPRLMRRLFRWRPGIGDPGRLADSLTAWPDPMESAGSAPRPAGQPTARDQQCRQSNLFSEAFFSSPRRPTGLTGKLEPCSPIRRLECVSASLAIAPAWKLKNRLSVGCLQRLKRQPALLSVISALDLAPWYWGSPGLGHGCHRHVLGTRARTLSYWA